MRMGRYRAARMGDGTVSWVLLWSELAASLNVCEPLEGPSHDHPSIVSAHREWCRVATYGVILAAVGGSRGPFATSDLTCTQCQEIRISMVEEVLDVVEDFCHRGVGRRELTATVGGAAGADKVDRCRSATVACLPFELHRFLWSMFESDHPPLSRRERIDHAEQGAHGTESVCGRDVHQGPSS
jgi:hypothetical protein